MIPKIIHYCWFGQTEIPQEEKEYMKTWKQLCPYYKIMKWDENNFDISTSSPYVKEAFNEKKWAFVSDYVRLYALSKFGGIYLDTDVEIKKKFDNLLDCDFFIGSESEYSVCTAVIGASTTSELLCKIMQLYEGKHFVKENGQRDEMPNSQRIYKLLANEYGFRTSTKIISFNKCNVYPCDYFSPLNYNTKILNFTENTYAIHHFASTWKGNAQKRKDYILALITRIIGEENREQIKRLIKREK